MQQWEYLSLTRTRKQDGFFNFTSKAWDRDIPAMLPELGKDGWELAGIVSGASSGKYEQPALTTDETWVFKRPLE